MSKNPSVKTTFFCPPSTKAEEKETNTILLVGDDPELAEFMITGLPDYKISRAVDGAEGLQKVFNLVPGLVMISAPMLVANGYDYFRKMKDDERTGHIPVILLMEKLTLDACFDDLALKADDFLMEPFAPGELRLRVNKIFKRLPSWQRTSNQKPDVAVCTTKKAVVTAGQVYIDPFLENVYAIIGENFDDSGFGVKELATLVCMSKVSLYRRLKLVTGLTPATVITNYRLQQAAQCLKEGFNSSETAFRTGFNSPAYFTKCFRKFYKLTPIEFLRKKP